MDIGTTITAILIALACIIPFVIMNKISSRRERQFLQPLFNMAQTNESSLSQYDTWSNSAVGIDHKKDMVFFFKKVNDTEISRQVNLSEVRKCRVIHVTKAAIDPEDNFRAVAKLELAFEHRDTSKEDTLLEFYNADADGGTLTGELQLVEKWRQIVDDKIAIR